jgi:phytoene dehydrogenase-like protein
MADQLANGSGATAQQSQQAQQQLILGSLFGIDDSLLSVQVMDQRNMAQIHGEGGSNSSSGVTGFTWTTGPTYTTLLKKVSDFYHLSAIEKAAMAQRLIDAGYLDPASTSGRRKRLDPTAVQVAFKDAVLDAARSDKTLDEVLDEGAANADDSNTTPAANSWDIAAGVKPIARQGLGRDLTPQEMASFQSQASSFDASSNASTSTAAPSAAGWQEWAGQRVREFDPKKFDARKVVAGVDVLANMLENGGVAVPKDASN